MHTARCGEVDLGWGLTRTRQKVRGVPLGAILQLPLGQVHVCALGAGFVHLGGFAVRYRRVYGGSPSATVRRKLFACASYNRSTSHSASQARPDRKRSGMTMDTSGYD